MVLDEGKGVWLNAVHYTVLKTEAVAAYPIGLQKANICIKWQHSLTAELRNVLIYFNAIGYVFLNNRKGLFCQMRSHHPQVSGVIGQNETSGSTHAWVFAPSWVHELPHSLACLWLSCCTTICNAKKNSAHWQSIRPTILFFISCM